jgi:hypothetical protein
MFLIDCRIDLILDNRLHNVEYRESESHTCEGSHIAGVSVDHGLGVEFRAVRVGCSQNDKKIVTAELVCDFFNCFLTFQVKCSGCCSDKALGLGENRLSPGTADAGFDSGTLDTVPFTDNDNLFSFQFHISSLLV